MLNPSPAAACAGSRSERVVAQRRKQMRDKRKSSGVPYSTTEPVTNKFVVDLYIRVSTDRQANEGDSLEEQEKELKKYCEFRGFQIHAVYIERGKSGGNTNRPEYQNLLKDIEAKKINAVVVKKIDRLSRSLLDFEAFMKLCQEKDVEFISIKDSFDTTNALGKAMLRIALIFAQLEREQTSERLIDVFLHRASKGLYNGGTRPFGYTSVNKELVPYPKERECVELMFGKFIDLKSTTQVAKLLNETGYRNRSNKLWDKREIQKILQRPIYKGTVQWQGNLYQGIHQPIITEKRFEQAQNIFKEQRYSSERNTNAAFLQKLVTCGFCQSPMTPSHSLNRFKKKYFYYRCTSTQNSEKDRSACQFKYVAFHLLDSWVKEILLSLSSESQFIALENKVLKHNQAIDQECQTIKSEINLLEHSLQTLKNKKEKYLDSLISAQFLSSERKIINDKIAELDLEEKQLKGKMYKQQFELNQKSEEQIDLTNLKRGLIRFKIEHEILDFEAQKALYTSLIENIIYAPEKLIIKLKLLPWPLDFT